jgi:hypothetical protein
VSDAVPLVAADERAHRPGGERLWGESWYFDFADRDGSLGGYVRLGVYPNLGVAWYWACLVGADRPLVTVIDHEVRPPRPGSLEIRADGLWADHTVEAAYDHMSLGCEAFAVAVDDPTEVYGDLRGERVPFGLDLEWDTDGGVYPWIGTTRYEVPCTVHGEILVGDEVIAFDGVGQRDHSWGVRDWWTIGWVWTAGWLADGTRFHTTRVRMPGLEAFAPGYVQAPGAGPQQIEVCEAAEELGPGGLPTTASITCGPLELAVAPLAFAPVHLVDRQGPAVRRARFPRALCRFEAADGRSGVGWTEWNQPQR